MRKLILLILLFIAIGCSENKETNDEFLNILKKAPSAKVSKENLPEWLIVKINEIEAIYSKDVSIVKVRIFKGEWEKQTVYFINDNLSSCIFCNVYYEDGKKLDFSVIDDEKKSKFCSENQKWELIYEFGEGLW